MRPHLAPVLSILLMASGCQTGGGVAPDARSGIRQVTLSSAQIAAVQGGVRRMVPNPESAEFRSTTAISASGEPGIHVCGHVKVKNDQGRFGEALPYYLELRETDGKPVPERGQVGSDAAKQAKITFMCRRNGPS